MARRVNEGSPAPLGVTLDDKGANIAVFSAHATAIDLCLFDETGSVEFERVRLPARTGDVFHDHVADIRPGQHYGLRAHGPYDPTEGHRFNANKLLVDPVWSKYWSDASISPIENLIALITVPVPHRRSG